MIEIVLVMIGAALIPSAAFATNLFPLPSDWLDLIATSTVPLMDAFGPMLWFLVGVSLFGWLVSKLTNH